MTQPDFRALCAELVDELNYHADEHSVDELISRARIALGQGNADQLRHANPVHYLPIHARIASAREVVQHTIMR